MKAWNRGQRSWTHESLKNAVTTSVSWIETIEKLKLYYDSGLIKRLNYDCKKYNINTTHFRRYTWNPQQLLQVVSESVSLRQVLTKLGIKPAGGNYKTVKQLIKKLNINIDHFQGQAHYKGKSTPSRFKQPLTEILTINSNYQTHPLKLRLIREGLKKEACEKCGWAEAAITGRIPIELHHINGDSSDNRIENLQILCPNHHALTNNHRGLNKKMKIPSTD